MKTFRRLPQRKLRHFDGDPAMLDVYVRDNNTTKLVVEMFPGVFVGVTLPTRYLVLSDDKPREPQIGPYFWKLFRSGKFTLETER